jgi:hypothetical protein
MSNSKDWAHDLTSGIAAAMGWFDPPEVLDGVVLAKAIRTVAEATDELGHMLLLRSIADALDHPHAERRLRLVKAKPGRPESRERFERAMVVGPVVARLVLSGMKKEAAIQQAMSEYRLSRSAVVRSSSEYEEYRRVFDPAQRDSNDRRHMHDRVIELDEVKGRSIRRRKGAFRNPSN